MTRSISTTRGGGSGGSSGGGMGGGRGGGLRNPQFDIKQFFI